jgi:hypothetical protein
VAGQSSQQSPACVSCSLVPSLILEGEPNYPAAVQHLKL